MKNHLFLNHAIYREWFNFALISGIFYFVCGLLLRLPLSI